MCEADRALIGAPWQRSSIQSIARFEFMMAHVGDNDCHHRGFYARRGRRVPAAIIGLNFAFDLIADICER
jgi:hypothetical protein